MSVRELENKWLNLVLTTEFAVPENMQEFATEQLNNFLEDVIDNIMNAKDKAELDEIRAFYNDKKIIMRIGVMRDGTEVSVIRNDGLMAKIERELQAKEVEFNGIQPNIANEQPQVEHDDSDSPDPFSQPTGGNSNISDPFAADPFTQPSNSDPFSQPTGGNPNISDPFAADPFTQPSNSDPFSQPTGGNPNIPDPFAADPFAADPFAADPFTQPSNSDPFSQPTGGNPNIPDPFAANATPPNGGSNGQIPDIELEDLSDLDNIQSSINDVINNPNMGVNALIDEYNEAKNKVDEILNEQILKMMTDEDLANNESFLDYYEEAHPNYGGVIYNIDDSDKAAWLESMSGKDGRKDRIRIASEYTRQGRDGWVEKVSDAEDEKSRKKKEIEDVGTRILQRLDNILKDFDAKIKRHEDNIKANMSNIDREIQRINGKIDALDKEKSEYQKAYQKSKKKDQHEYNQDIAEFERKIKEEKEKKEQYEKAKKRLEQNKKELQAKKEQRNKYDMLIQDEKRKFAQKLQNETNVEIQFDKSTYIKSTEENLPNNAPATATNGNRTTQIDIRKPTEIVAAQNIDLKHASTSEIMEMIDSKEGYGDLLEAAREAGHFSRNVVRKEMEKRLEDLLREKSGNTVEIGDARISKKDFYNLKKLNDDQINALIDRIKEYTKKYDKVQGYEQQKIDNEMQIFKLAVLLTETRTNHVQRWWFNHWPNFMKKSTSRVQDFGNDLRELARKVEDRSKFQESTKDRVFKKLGYELDPKTTKKTSLDRSGIKPIKQQGRDR